MSSRLDGTWRGWLWMIGLLMIAFGSAMWAVVGFLSGDALHAFVLFGPALVALGAVVLLLRAAFAKRR